MGITNVEQHLFLTARRSKIRAPRESVLREIRRVLGTLAVSAAAVCSTGVLLGSGLPETSATARDMVYPSTIDNHQATIQNKHPAQLASLLV